MFHSDTHIDLHQPSPLHDGQTSKVTKTQVLASLAVSTGSMIVGFCSAWSSPAIASLQEPGSRMEVSVFLSVILTAYSNPMGQGSFLHSL